MDVKRVSDVKHVLCFFVTFSGSTDVKSVWDVKCVCVFVTFSGSMDVKRVSDIKHVSDVKRVSDMKHVLCFFL